MYPKDVKYLGLPLEQAERCMSSITADYYRISAYRPQKNILTQREKQIAAMMIAGETTAKIAERLFIIVHTVNTHRKNILTKTNSKSAAELTAKIICEGLT